MKIFLDDVRKAPEGFILCKTPGEAIFYLEQGIVSLISLDHDLGFDWLTGKELTGYEVVKWIEEKVATSLFDSPNFLIHSANPVGRERMLRGIKSIERMVGHTLI